MTHQIEKAAGERQTSISSTRGELAQRLQQLIKSMAEFGVQPLHLRCSVYQRGKRFEEDVRTAMNAKIQL